MEAGTDLGDPEVGIVLEDVAQSLVSSRHLGTTYMEVAAKPLSSQSKRRTAQSVL